MSSAQVSEATTHPLSNRPRQSGRTPSGSRAANRVWPSVMVRQNAPLTRGSRFRMADNSPWPSPIWWESRAVITSESEG